MGESTFMGGWKEEREKEKGGKEGKKEREGKRSEFCFLKKLGKKIYIYSLYYKLGNFKVFSRFFVMYNGYCNA